MLPDDLNANFFDHKRRRDDIYDFGAFNLPRHVASALRDAFVDATGHQRRSSRRLSWCHVRKLGHFLESVESLDDHPTTYRTLLSDFAGYLHRHKSLRSNPAPIFNFVYRMVSSLTESGHSPLWEGQIITRHSFRREEKVTRQNDLASKQLVAISSACKTEIDKWNDAFKVRQAIVDNTPASHPDLSAKQVTKLRLLIGYEAQGIWTQRDFSPIKGAAPTKFSFRSLAPFRELTIRSALPFYLMIMIGSAGNPSSISDLTLNSIEDHPTDPNRAFLSWDKFRANREQSKPFLRAGPYAIPKLINQLIRMTEPIRHLTEDVDRNLVFITRNGKTSKAISHQSWHDALATFRTMHKLPDFTFADLRPTTAALIDRQHSSSHAATLALQHENKRTIKRYLNGHEPVERRFNSIAKFQGDLITLAMEKKSSPVNGRSSYQTLFGMSCADPTRGIAEGSRAGEPCLEFTQCATCLNAIVVYDDPRYVARILKARDGLVMAKNQSVYYSDASFRFSATYQRTLTIIENDILPSVPDHVMKEAQALIRDLPDIPTLD